jgi:hypothetical protein
VLLDLVFRVSRWPSQSLPFHFHNKDSERSKRRRENLRRYRDRLIDLREENVSKLKIKEKRKRKKRKKEKKKNNGK